MASELNSLDTILALLKQLEATVVGLRELRGYVRSGGGLHILESLIDEGETKIAEIKRKLVQ